MTFSIIIPVYNRPEEIAELLVSLSRSTYEKPFEVVIVEDGSTVSSREAVNAFAEKLSISYYSKPNTGPGDSRNYGMKRARGDYFIIFDSDCIIPEQYLGVVERELENEYVDCYGGPDAALDSFSDVQKAINFAMTSFLTTGGIRGGSEKLDRFQPRSFNMGISRTAFEASGGFSNIHPGEDPDLSIRLWKLGFQTRLLPAYVYHKRRIDWKKFYVQVNKFGKARPILDSWYPEYGRIIFYLPTLFMLGAVISLLLLLLNSFALLFLYLIYITAVLVSGSFKSKSLLGGAYALLAVFIQFFGYGKGFVESLVKIRILRQKPESAFPELFFQKS